MLDVTEIQARLPHRYPFLMVDRIIELEPGVRAVGIKNVTINEPHFTGHYPNQPVMPGVLIAEAMAQIGGLMFSGQDGVPDDAVPLLVGMDNMRFRRMVVPGDQLRIVTTAISYRRGMAKIAGEAYVDDELAAGGDILFALRSGSQ